MDYQIKLIGHPNYHSSYLFMLISCCILRHLIWVKAICSGVSVPIFKVNMLYEFVS